MRNSSKRETGTDKTRKGKHLLRTRLLSLSLLLLAGASCPPLLYAQTQIGNINYNLDEGTLTATVTGSVANTSTVSIPGTVTHEGKTYSVTSFGTSAFMNRSDVTSVSLPNTVTSIGPYAFSGCGSLKSINMSNSVTEIGGGHSPLAAA